MIVESTLRKPPRQPASQSARPRCFSSTASTTTTTDPPHYNALGRIGRPAECLSLDLDIHFPSARSLFFFDTNEIVVSHRERETTLCVEYIRANEDVWTRRISWLGSLTTILLIQGPIQMARRKKTGDRPLQLKQGLSASLAEELDSNEVYENTRRTGQTRPHISFLSLALALSLSHPTR